MTIISILKRLEYFNKLLLLYDWFSIIVVALKSAHSNAKFSSKAQDKHPNLNIFCTLSIIFEETLYTTSENKDNSKLISLSLF